MKWLRWLLLLIALLVVLALGWVLFGGSGSRPTPPAASKIAAATLRDPALIAKGEYLTTVGDCAGYWQLAHTALARCSCIRSRIERTFPDTSFNGGTFGGGGGGGVPSMFVSTYFPRETGLVRSSFDVSVKMLA